MPTGDCHRLCWSGSDCPYSTSPSGLLEAITLAPTILITRSKLATALRLSEETKQSIEAMRIFDDGIRLLSGYVNVNSKEGHGLLFDHLVLTTQGLGGDPYESAMLSLEKNRLYRYNFSWRRNDYFNPGLTTGDANGQHLLDTTYDLQDQDLELFPRSKVKFFLGFTNSSQSGAGLSTIALFQPHGDLFPLFTNVNRSQNEYRLGNELNFFGLRLNWMHGWQDFKEDTGYQFNGLSLGDQPGSGAALNSFLRAEPYHGTSPFWRVALFGEKRFFSVNGRFTYTAGERAFVLDESALGMMQVGAAANRQILTFGNGQRPVATGNLTFSVFPSSKITVVNQTSVYNVRTEGENVFTQFDNATQTAQSLNFQYLGIRTVANDTDVNVETSRWLSLRLGYEYSNRRINSTQQFASVGGTFAAPFSQTNELNAGRFGFRIRPLKPLSISADVEVGSANRPFAPKSDANYLLIEGRVQYKLKTLQLSAFTNADYNVNSVTLSAYSSHARTYSATATWTPVRWFAFRRQLFQAAFGYGRRNRIFCEHAIHHRRPIVLHQQHTFGEFGAADSTASACRSVPWIQPRPGYWRWPKHSTGRHSQCHSSRFSCRPNLPFEV